MEVAEKEPRDYFEVGVELYLKTCQGNHKATADQEAPSEIQIERIDAYKMTLCFGVKWRKLQLTQERIHSHLI